MASNDRELRVKVVVDSSGAVKSFQVLKEELRDTEEAAKRGGDSFSRLQAGIVTLNQGVQLARSAFQSFQSIISQTGEVLTRGLQVDGLARSFDNLQSSVGATASNSLQSLRDATQGLVSDFDLFQQANQAVLLGVDDGSGRFAELAEAALTLGAATGRTATEALTDLTTAIGRGSVLIADNLGIQVKAAEAQQLYAQSIGTTVDKLTDQQKSQALSNAIAEQAIVKAQQLAGVQQNAGVAFQGVAAQIQNLKDQFATAIVENDNLARALQDLGKTLSEIDVKQFADSLATLASVFVDLTNKAVRFTDRFVAGLNEVRDVFSRVALGRISQEAAASFQAIVDGSQALSKTEANAQALQQELTKLNIAIINSGKSSPALTAALERASRSVLRFKDGVKDANEELKKLNEQSGNRPGDGGGGGGGGGVARLTGEFQQLEKTINDIFRGPSLDGIQREFEQIFAGEAAAGAGDTERALRAAIDRAKELGVAASDLNSTLQKAAVSSSEIFGPKTLEQAKAAGDVLTGTLGDLDQLFSTIGFPDLAEGLTDPKGLGLTNEIADLIGNSITTAFDIALNGGGAGDIGAAIGSIVGSFVGSIAGPVGSAVGSQVGAITGEKFAENVEEAFKGDAASATSSAIFAFIDTIFFGIGSALDAVFGGALEQSLRHLFGDNATTRAIQAADRFFARVFEENRLQIIIQDQLVDVFDFRFLDANTEEFRQFFSTLPEIVQGAFNAVGFAFDAFFDDIQAIPDVIALAFAGNLEADLFNLQLAIQATGGSVEELQEGLIDAALAGEISFLEAQGAVNQLNVLLEDGIPGSVGAVLEAFDKVKAAGVTGGRVTVKALQAIAVEAEELGVTTLPGLEDALIAAGATEADVAILIAAFEKFGFSIEDIINATEAELVPILADLEAQGFAFAEQANEDVQALLDTFDRIPRNLETDWRINVSTNATDAGARLFLETEGRAL